MTGFFRILVVLILSATAQAGDHGPKTPEEWDREVKERVTALFRKLPIPAQIITLTFVRETERLLKTMDNRQKRLEILTSYTSASDEELEKFLNELPAADPARDVVEKLVAARQLGDDELEAKLQNETASEIEEAEFYSRLKRLGITELSQAIGIRPGNLLKLARTILSDSPDAYYVAQNVAGYVRVNEQAHANRGVDPKKLKSDLEKLSLARVEKLQAELTRLEAEATSPEAKKLMARLSAAAEYQIAVLKHADFSVSPQNSEKLWAYQPGLVQAGHSNEETRARIDRQINKMFSRCDEWVKISVCPAKSEEGQTAHANLTRLYTGDRADFGLDRMAQAMEAAQARLKIAGEEWREDPIAVSLVEQARNWATLLGKNESALLAGSGLTTYATVDLAGGDKKVLRKHGMNEAGPVRLQLPDTAPEIAAFPSSLARSLHPSTKAAYDASVPAPKLDHPLAIENIHALLRSYEYDPKTKAYGSSAKYFARDIVLGSLGEYALQHAEAFDQMEKEKDPEKRKVLIDNYAQWVAGEMESWSGFKDYFPADTAGAGLALAGDLSRYLADYLGMGADLAYLFPRVNPKAVKVATGLVKNVATVGEQQIALALPKEPVLTALAANSKPKTTVVPVAEVEIPPPTVPRTPKIEVVPTPPPDVPAPQVYRPQPSPSQYQPQYQPQPRRRFLFRRRG